VVEKPQLYIFGLSGELVIVMTITLKLNKRPTGLNTHLTS